MHDYTKRSGKKRLRFRDWLLDQLDNNEIEGVQWIDRERGLFKIPWTHGSHQNWKITDAEVFRQWAIYSGKYKPSRDVPDPRKWKTNFRCMLNALPDFKEVRNESSSRGPRRFKIYSLKSTGQAKKEQSGCEKEKKQTVAFDHNLTDKAIVQLVDEMMTPVPVVRPALQKPLLITRARPNANFPAFETLVLGKSTGISPFPHTPWFLAAWNAMAVDQHVEEPGELKKFADESAEESGSEGTAKGVQTKRLVKKQQSRVICTHERTFTEEELAYAQEIIDLVEQMSDSGSTSLEELDGTEESNEEEDEMPSDQEIIDIEWLQISDSPSPEELDGTGKSNEKEDEEPSDQEIIDLVDRMVDRMAEDSSTEELDGTEESNDEDDEEPSDQEIIDLVDQMAEDSDKSSPEVLYGTEESNEKDDKEPSDQEIIDLVDQMSDFSSEELDGTEKSNEKEFSEDASTPTEKTSFTAGLEDSSNYGNEYAATRLH